MENMSDGYKQILSPFPGHKNKKLGIKLRKNLCWKKEDKILLLSRKGIILQSRGMIRRILR